MASLTDYRGVLATEEPRQGILAGIGQGGILSGIRDLRNRERGRRPVLDFLGDNAAALRGFGIPLLLARTQRQAFEGAIQGAASGRQVDYARGKERREEASQARKEQALATVLQHYGLDSGLSALPELAQAAVLDAMKGDEREGLINAGGGQLYDPNTGQWITAPNTARPEAPDLEDFWNPETNQLERRTWNPQTGEWEVEGFGKPPSSQSMTFNPETGQFEFRQGAGADMTPTTRTGVQKDLITAEDALARLNQIGADYKPEYATLGGQLGNEFRSWRAWANLGNIPWIGSLSPEEQTKLQEYATWRATTAANLNQYLNDMSGAAISPHEAVRLMKALPNEGDDPITFKAKLDRSIRDIQTEIARYSARLGGAREGEDGWQELGPGVRFRELP